MIYSIFNDLADIAIKLTMDHLLYADDVTLTAPRKQADFNFALCTRDDYERFVGVNIQDAIGCTMKVPVS